MKTRLVYSHKLLTVIERYRTALRSVSGPEAAFLYHRLETEFKDIINLIDGPKTTPKPLKRKTHGKK